MFSVVLVCLLVFLTFCLLVTLLKKFITNCNEMLEGFGVIEGTSN